MGMHVEGSYLPHTTPRVFVNACGYLTWGGIAANDLSAAQQADMLQFCEAHGYTCGWNAAGSNPPAAPNELHKAQQACNVFSPQLLGGRPHEVFARAFWCGVQDWKIVSNRFDERCAEDDGSAWLDTN